MAWKQDLAKLKQQLGPDTPSGPAKAQPKVAPKSLTPATLDDEDAVFLSAMGLRPSTKRAAPAPAVDIPVAAPAPPPAPETFQEALRDLKGLKPMEKPRLNQAAAPVPKAAKPMVPAAPAPSTAPPKPTQATRPPAEPEPLPPPSGPSRFQLAAGMAIEVDGSLDLRGHSVLDAVERLKDRLGDGVVLGWRSLQVTLGPDPALHEGLLGLLASGEAPMVVRYAQAPVPMGGTQAWLLYLGPSPVQG